MSRQKFFLADGTDLPCEENSYDLVLVHDVLSNIEDKAKAISEMLRVSKRYLVICEGIDKKGQTFIREIAGKLKIFRTYYGDSWDITGYLKTRDDAKILINNLYRYQPLERTVGRTLIVVEKMNGH